MLLKSTDDNEVTKNIEGIKNKKSPGHDGFSNEGLQVCSPILGKFSYFSQGKKLKT